MRLGDQNRERGTRVSNVGGEADEVAGVEAVAEPSPSLASPDADALKREIDEALGEALEYWLPEVSE